MESLGALVERRGREQDDWSGVVCAYRVRQV